MPKQIKDILLLLLCFVIGFTCSIIFSTCNTIKDKKETTEASVIVEQKSVINEQEMISENHVKKQLAEVETETQVEEESLSPYKDLIDNLTEEEKYLIYQITFAEANNQPIEGQRAVIEVILNRVMSDSFPNTVEEVLSQPRQFSTWKVRNYVEHNKKQELALLLVKNEKPILNENYMIFSGAKFNWGKDYIQIKDHWFGAL